MIGCIPPSLLTYCLLGRCRLANAPRAPTGNCHVLTGGCLLAVCTVTKPVMLHLIGTLHELSDVLCRSVTHAALVA